MRRRKTNPFVPRKQEAQAPSSAPETITEPDPNAMTEAQLDKELERAKEDIRRMKAAELERVRQEVGAAKPQSKTGGGGSKSRFIFAGRRRRPWK